MLLGYHASNRTPASYPANLQPAPRNNQSCSRDWLCRFDGKRIRREGKRACERSAWGEPSRSARAPAKRSPNDVPSSATDPSSSGLVHSVTSDPPSGRFPRNRDATGFAASSNFGQPRAEYCPENSIDVTNCMSAYWTRNYGGEVHARSE